MSTSVAVTFVLIILARIADVTLDTLRTAAIVQGRRVFAGILGFFEAVIYVCAVAKVLLNLDHPIYALAYGLGYGMGTFLGITIEQRLAFGVQVVSLFTRNGAELAKGLILAGHRVVKVEGHIRDGEVSILYVEVPRKQTRKLISDAATLDKTCFCVVNDVRAAGYANGSVNPKMSQR